MATKEEWLDALAAADDDEDILIFDESSQTMYDLSDSGIQDGKRVMYIEEVEKDEK